MANPLQIGDNFDVVAKKGNGEGVDFYILQCQWTKHVLQEAFTCAWGCTFEITDYVVSSTYYQKWGHNKNNYVCLTNSQVVFLTIDLVLTSKFSMLPTHHRVKGDEHIYQIL